MVFKIALEEAISLPSLTHKLVNYVPANRVESLSAQLLDIHGQRLSQMDEYNVTYMILSITTPGPQDETDPIEASRLAKQINDELSTSASRNPTRFGFFSTLSMHDPAEACAEAIRSVQVLGAKGILLNDFQECWTDEEKNKKGVIFYDQPKWDPLWETLQMLDVPLYIHPRTTTQEVHELFIKERPWLGTSVYMFAFGVYTAKILKVRNKKKAYTEAGVSLHVLGMYTNGVFDRFPRLQVVIGHMGEFIPYQLWRIDFKLQNVQKGRGLPTKQTLREVFRKNIHITTSGFFSTPVLLFAIQEIGIDRIMFSIDYPYEKFSDACDWFDEITELSEDQKAQIAMHNARKLLKLS